MDKFKAFLNAATGDMLWAVILVPILAISWIGFYTIARDVGIPSIFAAGMSAAFDGVALFAARIGLKHRRKGFSGYLARITVIAFAALGAFVQSFHAETHAWILAHSWIVWATAPVAAVLAYELHLGWVHRKQLIRMGYHHPSAKSGFGPATWIHFPSGTWSEYRDVLRARRTFIAKANLARFGVEEAAQPQLPPTPKATPKATPKPECWCTNPLPCLVHGTVVPERPPGRERLHVVPPTGPSKSSSTRRPSSRLGTSRRTSSKNSRNAQIRQWCLDNGYKLGHNNRIPIAGLNAYRAAERAAS